MRVLPMLGAALGAASIAAPAVAQSPMQPPMDGLDDAYYVCDGGDAFLVAYDDNPPQAATVTTNDDNKRYVMKRETAASGVQFSGDGARFWTDGKTVTVAGTPRPFRNCKLKSG